MKTSIFQTAYTLCGVTWLKGADTVSQSCIVCSQASHAGRFEIRSVVGSQNEEP